jgi:hypothetical protein
MGSTWGNLSSYGEFEIAGAHAQKPRLLGEGSFGKTFEAFRSDRYPGGEVKEWVALKVLNPALLQTEEKRFQFLQEVSALAKFKHQNLVHLIRGGQEGDEVYYAMELCMGGDLRKLVARFGSIPEKAVALIGAQVTSGLREVHDRHGLIHRDIKPENIVLVEEIGRGITRQQLADCFEQNEGLCRIVDFGLVNLEIDTQEGRKPFAGSPMYASPEQIRRDSIDQATDVYSLGLTLLYLLKGKGPLLAPDGSDFKSVSSLIDHKISDYEHANDIPPWVSAEFRAILLKMLSKDPATRLGAAEAQAALREYLNSRLKLVRFAGTLKNAYVLGEPLAESGRAPGWLARRKEGDGAEVRLTVAAWLRMAGAPGDPEARGREICDIAQRATDSARPGTFLRVLRIVQTDDALAFEEEHIPSVSLEEVLRARAARKNNLSMTEAVTILRPVAEAFDSLRSKIFIGCEDILLVAEANGLPVTAPLDRPLAEWPDLEVRISCMGEAVALGEVQTAQTLVESATPATPLDQTEVDTSAAALSHLQPVPVLCRLLYRLLTGSDVDAAAAYSPMAFIPAARLRATTNNHLRDLLCGSEPASSAVETLRRFCAFESVPWEGGPRSRPAAPDATSSTDEIPSLPEKLSSSTSEATMVAPAREPGSAGRSRGADAKIKETSGGVSRGSGTAKGTRSAPSGTALYGEAPICEVVRPGVVRSPFDEEQREQTVPPEQWKSGQSVQCASTHRHFRLPRKLELLLGTVLEPKFVESPYDPGHRQEVPWPQWVPNGELVCQDSGARFRLPADLPFLEGKLLAEPGVIQSPYDPRELVTVPAESWLPGAWIVCPSTEVPFLLPTPLPPLRAIADPLQPGVLRSPYAPDARIEIPPARWEVGLELECPVSHRKLSTPPEVEQWEVVAQVVNAARRSVRDPFDPKALLEVPGLAWVSGGTFPHPRSARPIRLPQGLPELVGEIDASRPGFARSPFTGEWFRVSEGDWSPGASMTCPGTERTFRLPDKLPEIPREGKLASEPGTVISPCDSATIMRVPAARWRPGELLECETTRKKFRLPAVLPPLVGAVDAERIGWVYSPHSEQWQQVPFESWMPRNTLKCEGTGQPFKLPDTLPEWLPDVHWIPRRPGRVRSPHNPAAEIDVAPAQWQSGAVLICPSTHRRCRVPVVEDFPSLELEKGAVFFAARLPEKQAAEAAEALSRPGQSVSVATVQAIWDRHQLSTGDERRAFRTEIFPEPAEKTTSAPVPRQPRPAPKKPTRWLPYAAAALVVAGLIGTAVKLLPKTGSSTIAVATPTPVPTPEPPPVGGRGSFSIQEPPLSRQPAKLTFSYNQKDYDIPVDAPREQGLLTAAVPRPLRSLGTLKTQLKAPGWLADCTLTADGNGDFQPAAPVAWARTTAPLSISRTSTDYERLVATWVRSLPSEPGATPPAQPIEIKLAEEQEPPLLPTGIYKLTLEGPAGSKRVTSWVLAADQEVSVDDPPRIQIPRSLAGEYWGFWSVDIQVKGVYPATFLIFRVQPKATGVIVEEVEIPRGPLDQVKEFRSTDKRPMIGATSLVEEVQLVSPTKLLFRVPIEELEWSVEFEARESNPRLVVDVGARKSPKEINDMRQKRLTYFNSEVELVRKKKLWNMFRDEDAKNLESGKVEKLGRHPLLNSSALYEQHYESRFEFLTGWSIKVKARPEIELYPIQTILYPNPPHGEKWNETPTRPPK